MRMHQHRNLTPATAEKKSDYPLEGKSLQSNVIYQATVTTETTTET